MNRILRLWLGGALLAGCTDRLPTDVAPDDLAGRANAAIAVAAHARTNALDGVDDALDRILPALSDAAAARGLAAALAGVRTALDEVDAEGMPALLDAARGAVDRYARTGTDQADLDAVRLALDYAAAVAAAD
jgi:hypothetical protein